jgi:hypothetical protein
VFRECSVSLLCAHTSPECSNSISFSAIQQQHCLSTLLLYCVLAIEVSASLLVTELIHCLSYLESVGYTSSYDAVKKCASEACVMYSAYLDGLTVAMTVVRAPGAVKLGFSSVVKLLRLNGINTSLLLGVLGALSAVVAAAASALTQSFKAIKLVLI